MPLLSRGLLQNPRELSLPGFWSRYRGAHLLCRLQGYIQATGRGGHVRFVSSVIRKVRTVPMSLSIADQKVAARKVASAARKQAAADVGRDAASVAIADNFLNAISLQGIAAVSGFLPIGSEIDTRPLLRNVLEQGVDICLPAVIARDHPLEFRQWRDGDPLIDEDFGTKAPAATAKVMEPDILIVPLLAFDRAGYRLGYGGGFYDRSLEKLRLTKNVLAVGVAFAGQEAASVPRDENDQPLDWIVTEREAFRPETERT